MKNWAGNIEYRTARVYAPRSLEEVRRFVQSQPRIKALGTRHCFNAIADSSHTFLSLASMDERVSVDRSSRTVTISAGITYGALCPRLHGQGFALHNLASLPHISVAGACATATHGSGEKNGNLATSVAALEIVTAVGDVVSLSREKDRETFLGAVVGLGALGVVTRITLKVKPTFVMRQDVYLDLPLEELLEHFDEIQARGYSISLFTDWQKRRINQVWIKSRVAVDERFAPAPGLFGATAATANVHPIGGVSAENCTQQVGIAGAWHERLPHFRMDFLPSAGEELQAEYFVPRKNAVEAILAMERIREQIAPLLLISEIRTVAADDFWLSPCYQRPSVAIHFTLKREWDGVSNLLPVIERELAPYDARPHWGKLFTMPAARVKSQYAKLADFTRLAKQFDPSGKFRNDFLNQYLLEV